MVARCPRLIGDDRDRAARQRIEQGTLADIGRAPPDDHRRRDQPAKGERLRRILRPDGALPGAPPLGVHRDDIHRPRARGTRQRIHQARVDETLRLRVDRARVIRDLGLEPDRSQRLDHGVHDGLAGVRHDMRAALAPPRHHALIHAEHRPDADPARHEARHADPRQRLLHRRTVDGSQLNHRDRARGVGRREGRGHGEPGLYFHFSGSR